MRSSRSRSGADRQPIEMQDNEEQKEDDMDERIMSQVSARSLDEAAAEERRVERQRLREKEESKRQLAKMLLKEGGGRHFQKESRSDGKERLNFLLKQTELFTNFIVQSRNMKGAKKQQDLQQVQKNMIMSMRQMGGKGTSRRGNKKATRNFGEGGDAADADDGNFTITRLTTQPSILQAVTLRDYQLDSLNWMIGLYETGINGILADEMGLGKTIQAISLLCFLREYKQVKNYFLIIVPKAVIPHWKKEFKRVCPEIRVLNLIATKAEREEILRTEFQPGKFDVCLTTFEGVRICMTQCLKFKWEYIIVDEAHKIKNEESQISKRLRQLDSRYRLLLTGTPLQNNLHELWSLLNFLLPEIFSSADAFDEMFDLNQDIEETEAEKEKRNKQVIEQLHRILRPFLLRRIKKEVEQSLPAKVEIHVTVGITEQQKSIYRDLLKKSMIEKGNSVTYYKNILIQLRKVCNHPYLFENQEAEGADENLLVTTSGKMIFVDKLLKKSIADGNQTLLFSGFTTMLDILEDYCNYRGHKYCRLDGNSSLEDREKSIDEFTAPGSEKQVFLVSTRAGGLGLNLMSANIVILYDSDWNPQVDLQAMDRAHRIGQTKVVQVFRLITKNTMEHKMIERQTMKLKLDSLIIQKGRLAPKAQGLGKDEMQDMVNFGADNIFQVGNDFCDDDIDKLIQEGKDRANKMQIEAATKLKSKMNMADFEMNSMNLYQFEDVDYKKRREDQLKMDEHLRTMIIADDTGNRRRKTHQKNLNERNLCPKINFVRNSGISDDTKRKKLQIVQDFRFFPNPDRVKELIEKEIDSKYAGYLQGIEYVDFTEEEKIEKQFLLDQGFVNWDRRDFQKTVQALELYPREETVNIAKHISTKTPEQVKKYLDVFFRKMDTLTDYVKIRRNLDKAESLHDFKKQAPNLIKQKVTGYDRPVEEMKLEVVQKSKYFSKEADIVLLCLTHEHGYGNWSGIKNAVRRDTRCRFDHLFMSRSEQELSKRVDILVKSLIAEIAGTLKKDTKVNKGLNPENNEDDDCSDIEMLYEPGQGITKTKEQRDEDMIEHDEDELRIGDDRPMSNDSIDEGMKEEKPMLVGDKRKRDEFEEEDMDFEAIDDEMKKQHMCEM